MSQDATNNNPDPGNQPDQAQVSLVNQNTQKNLPENTASAPALKHDGEFNVDTNKDTDIDHLFTLSQQIKELPFNNPFSEFQKPNSKSLFGQTKSEIHQKTGFT